MCFYTSCFMNQVRMRELWEREAVHGAHPSALKAAVCADLMLKMLQVLGRYSTVSAILCYAILYHIIIL